MAHVLAKDLRASVLQAAMEGKLTEQLDSDSSVDDLLKDIQREKKKLVKEGKIKKEKPLAPIKKEEIPFEIPENWSFTKLGFISTYASSKNKINAQHVEGNLWMLDLEDIKKGGNLLTKKKVSDFKAKGDKTYFNKGDILYSKLRPYLQKILIADEEGICTPELVPFKMYGNINSFYIMFFLKSPYVNRETNCASYGTKMPRVSTETMVNLYVPLPPIEEQQRIVDKLNKLMPLIDEYEKLENQMTELKKNFPEEMKASILQAAMQGKLTEQLKSDGDVYEYLDDIASLKASLIQEKKLKKDKTTDIVEDEYPFDIPDSWAWTKFGAIANLRPGKTPPRAEPAWWGDKNDVPWVSIADMIADGHVSKTKEFISHAGFKEKFKESISPAGTMIMSFKLTVGRVSYLDIDALHNEAIISIFPFKDDNNILQSYLFKVLPYLTKYGDSKNAIKGTTLNENSLCNLYIPLPPFKEQQRIVDKLDQLLPLCEQLEKMAA